MNSLFTAAFAAAAIASIAAPASAQPAGRDGRYSATIRHGDLNLASADGRATFRGRVKALANQVCGTAPLLPFHEEAAVEQCRAQLFRQAEARVSLAVAPAGSDLAATR
jgi:UrcA family protein